MLSSLAAEVKAKQDNKQDANRKRVNRRAQDAKRTQTGRPDPVRDPELAQYGIYEKTAPRAASTLPVATTLPLTLNKGDRIALIGNTLLDRAQDFGYFEALLHQRFPEHEFVIRNLAWSADTPDLQPRPANFADTEQHLTHERVDVIFAAFGFNESFAGAAGIPKFRQTLADYVAKLKSRAFNGKSGPRIVLISPIANENLPDVAAADMNNGRIKSYSDVMKSIAIDQQVGFADVFGPTLGAMSDAGPDLTFNGVHLVDAGYEFFAKVLYREVFHAESPPVNDQLRQAIVDKNRQYFRRYRPVNTFYYTGDRNSSYGYLDFLPAMRNFDIMVANRDRYIWSLAQGKNAPPRVDDTNVSRGQPASSAYDQHDQTFCERPLPSAHRSHFQSHSICR
jgi:hypothetical protein